MLTLAVSILAGTGILAAPAASAAPKPKPVTLTVGIGGYLELKDSAIGRANPDGSTTYTVSPLGEAAVQSQMDGACGESANRTYTLYGLDARKRVKWTRTATTTSPTVRDLKREPIKVFNGVDQAGFNAGFGNYTAMCFVMMSYSKVPADASWYVIDNGSDDEDDFPRYLRRELQAAKWTPILISPTRVTSNQIITSAASIGQPAWTPVGDPYKP